MDGARSSAGTSGLPSGGVSASQESSSAHFSQTQSRGVQEDKAEALKVPATHPAAVVYAINIELSPSRPGVGAIESPYL